MVTEALEFLEESMVSLDNNLTNKTSLKFLKFAEKTLMSSTGQECSMEVALEVC